MKLLIHWKTKQYTTKVSEWINNVIPEFMMYVITHPCYQNGSRVGDIVCDAAHRCHGFVFLFVYE